MSDPDVLRQRLTEAGLKDVRVERTFVERPAFASGQEMWDWMVYGNPIPGMLVADLSEDQQGRLRQVLDERLRERADANGRAVLTNAVNIGIGTKCAPWIERKPQRGSTTNSSLGIGHISFAPVSAVILSNELD